jgi:hypothetical protein
MTTLVFVGPTLSDAEAQQRLPDARSATSCHC